MPDDLKPMQAPIILEKNFLVGGKRVTVQVVFPASVSETVGLENVYMCAQSLIVRAEGKNVPVKELKLGE